MEKDELRQHHFPDLVDRIVRVLYQAVDFFLRHYGRRMKFSSSSTSNVTPFHHPRYRGVGC